MGDVSRVISKGLLYYVTVDSGWKVNKFQNCAAGQNNLFVFHWLLCVVIIFVTISIFIGVL
jgi:hypothetical protein